MVHWVIIVLLLLVLLHTHINLAALRKVAARLDIPPNEMGHRALLGMQEGLANTPNPRVDQNVPVGQLLTHADRMEMKFMHDDQAARKRRAAAVKG